jgi:hypothetical protein
VDRVCGQNFVGVCCVSADVVATNPSVRPILVDGMQTSVATPDAVQRMIQTIAGACGDSHLSVDVSHLGEGQGSTWAVAQIRAWLHVI